MKKLISIIALCLICMIGKSQSDSLKEMYDNYEELRYDFKSQWHTTDVLKSDIHDIRLNLTKFHKQYKEGLGFTILGIVISGVGVALSSNNINGVPVIITGGALSLVGSMVMIDSHKFIKRAGITIPLKNKTIYRYDDGM